MAKVLTLTVYVNTPLQETFIIIIIVKKERKKERKNDKNNVMTC